MEKNTLFHELIQKANREISKKKQIKIEQKEKSFQRKHSVKDIIDHHRKEIEKFIDAFINDNLISVQNAILLKKNLEKTLKERKEEKEIRDAREKLEGYQKTLENLLAQYLYNYVESGKTDLTYDLLRECEINNLKYSDSQRHRIHRYIHKYYVITYGFDHGEKYYEIYLLGTIFSRRYLKKYSKRLILLPVSMLEIDSK